MAVVVGRNRFGLALGLFDGVVVVPRARAEINVRPPVYTDEQLISTGRWKIVDHDEKLLLTDSIGGAIAAIVG